MYLLDGAVTAIVLTGGYYYSSYTFFFSPIPGWGGVLQIRPLRRRLTQRPHATPAYIEQSAYRQWCRQPPYHESCLEQVYGVQEAQCNAWRTRLLPRVLNVLPRQQTTASLVM